MKKVHVLLAGTLLFPSLAFAQADLQTFLRTIPDFFNGVVVPFLFGIAFLVFVFNAVRYFVIQGANEEGRENAKSLVLYSVFAFVLLIVFWGVVAMLSAAVGLECDEVESRNITSDYILKDLVGPTTAACP